VPEGGDQLVQPVRVVVAVAEHARETTLLGGPHNALAIGRPEIFITDQGFQFTARKFTNRLEEAGIAVSRDAAR
jgi:hypothetical protein